MERPHRGPWLSREVCRDIALIPCQTLMKGSEEVKPGFILDYNEKNEIVGFEILHVASRVPASNLRQLQFEVA